MYPLVVGLGGRGGVMFSGLLSAVFPCVVSTREASLARIVGTVRGCVIMCVACIVIPGRPLAAILHAAHPPSRIRRLSEPGGSRAT